ncbi:hypothetical protein KY334_06605 [Candidatus Woesearchaeota archaeon]|nr:hypothetical protein [Candidatus Woesearchaeota archaeon]
MAIELNELKKKYLNQITGDLDPNSTEVRSRDYINFRSELIPRTANWYEKWCNAFEKFMRLNPPPNVKEEMQNQIDVAHLNVTPEGVYSFSFLFPMLLVLISIVGFVVIPTLFSFNVSMFFLMVSLLISLVLILPLQRYPKFLAASWRSKTTNQMVLCVFYLVAYLRHTSNLERAIEFAADHLDPPLSLDLERILWSVENETFDNLKDALDDYLRSWKKFNEDFIDAIHLLESSLLESDNARRLSLLDKSLDVILEGTYERMLHYAQNLKNPITTLHMLGVILPILGLVILPLAVSFLEGLSWVHLAVFYNVLLPVSVFFLSKNILSTRPSGYGDSDITKNKEVQKKSKVNINLLGLELSISPFIIALSTFFIIFIFGLVPLFFYGTSPGDDLCWDFRNPTLTGAFFCNDLTPEAECLRTYCAWDYKSIYNEDLDEYKTVGPFGFLSSLLSLFIPLALGIGVGIYYRLKSTNVIKIRNETKRLEKEFSTALFQLGNRLGDGLPAEIAIPRVGELMSDTVSGQFFNQVSNNMQRLGMGLEDAIFDKENGALVNYPSKIIGSTMKVLVESMKKGPNIAAQAMDNVARYIKEIHRVDERLKDLLSDIISSMKQQISFLAPTISGVVIGITSMITYILGSLSNKANEFSSEGASFNDALNLGVGIPTFYFQIVVGIYVVQIVYILTIMANSVENGEDKLGERNLLGINLFRSTIMYIGIAFVVMIVFQLMAGQITNSI